MTCYISAHGFSITFKLIAFLTFFLPKASSESEEIGRFVTWVANTPSMQPTIVSDRKFEFDKVKTPMSWTTWTQWNAKHYIRGYDSGIIEAIIIDPPVNKSLSEILLLIDNQKLRSRKPFYFIFLTESFRENITRIHLDSNMASLELDSNVYILFLHPQSHFGETNIPLKIFELYSIKNITILQRVVTLREYFDGKFLDALAPVAFRRQNYRGIEIIGVAQDWTQYIWTSDWKTDENGNVQFGGGYNVEEYRYLRDALNFTEVDLAGSGFVREGPDGALLGMGAQISKGEADISIINSELAEYRLKKFAFLHPTSQETLFAYFKQLPSSALRNIYFQPFSLSIWLSGLGGWIVLISSITWLFWIKKKLNSLELIDGRLSEEKIIWSLGTICQQGWHIFPTATSTRLIVLSGLWMCLILYNGYSAALVSILSYPDVAIKSFVDIVDQNFKIYVEENTLAAISLLTSLEPKGFINDKSRKIDGFQGMDVVLKFKTTFIAPPYQFYPIVLKQNYTDHYLCENVARVIVDGPPKLSGMFVKKGSPLKETLNYKILQMYERGIRSRLYRYYWKKIQLPCPSDQCNHRPINIIDAFSPIIVMLSGFVGSLIFFTFEMLMVRLADNLT